MQKSPLVIRCLVVGAVGRSFEKNTVHIEPRLIERVQGDRRNCIIAFFSRIIPAGLLLFWMCDSVNSILYIDLLFLSCPQPSLSTHYSYENRETKRKGKKEVRQWKAGAPRYRRAMHSHPGAYLSPLLGLTPCTVLTRFSNASIIVPATCPSIALIIAA